MDLLLQADVRETFLGLPPALILLLVVAVAAVGSWILDKMVVATLASWARRSRIQLDDILVKAMHPSLAIVLFLLVTWLAVQYIPLGLSPLTAEIFHNVSVSLTILAVGIAVVRLLSGLMRIPAQKDARYLPMSTIGVRVTGAILWIVIFLTILRQYNVEISPILATLGVAGLAVALALQDTLGNFFSGIWIQSGKTFRPGHFVKVEEKGLEGFVEEVGWRTTKIRTLPGNLIIVPNATMAQSTITDYSLPAEKMGTSLTIMTGFEADPDKVVKMILEEARAATKDANFILDDPPPAARLNQALDRGWEFWCGFWVAHYYDQWNARGIVLNRVRGRFLKENIRMPLPIQEHYDVPRDRADVAGSVASVASNGQQGLRAEHRRPGDPGTSARPKDQ